MYKSSFLIYRISYNNLKKLFLLQILLQVVIRQLIFRATQFLSV